LRPPSQQLALTLYSHPQANSDVPSRTVGHFTLILELGTMIVVKYTYTHIKTRI
jgi:hypothetical protein